MKVVEAARKANVKNGERFVSICLFNYFNVYARTCFLISGMYVYTSNNVYIIEKDKYFFCVGAILFFSISLHPSNLADLCSIVPTEHL